VEDPPQTDGHTEEELASATEDQAVATEAPVEDSVELLDPGTPLVVEQGEPVASRGLGLEDDAPPPRCVNCGETAIYETDGRSSSQRAFCAKDLPVNVTHAMVEAYRVRRRR
jgi:hypothetical protein